MEHLTPWTRGLKPGGFDPSMQAGDVRKVIIGGTDMYHRNGSS